MKIGSLFSGYGGLDMAVEAVTGAKPAWFVEFDKAPSKILAHHWPDVPNYGDVTKVDWSAVEPVDIITGGSPCQDLSHAGKRAGMTEGTRSNLWVAMREAIAQLRPGLVVWENVRGAYSAAADSEVEPCAGCVGDRPGVTLRALGRVLGDLSELGYDCRWHGLRAADVGAPHGRFRVFVVAYADGGVNLPRSTWADQRAVPQGDGRGTAPALLPTPRTSDTNGAGLHGQGGLDLRTAVDLLPTPTTRDFKGHNQRGDTSCLSGALTPTPRATDGTKGGPNQRGSSGDLMLPSAVQLIPTPLASDAGPRGGTTGFGLRDWSRASANGEHRLLPTPTAGDAKQGYVTRERHDARAAAKRAANPNLGDLHEDLPLIAQTTQDWGIYADAIARWEHLTRPAPAPTQPSKKGTPQLSPAFSEWLMGLPAGWVTAVPGLSRNDMLKALGNGVVPQQAAAALRFLLSVEVAA